MAAATTPITDTTERWAMAAKIAAVIVFNYACFMVMTVMAVMSEARPAIPGGRLPDMILDMTPYSAWVFENNYFIWIGALLTGIFSLLILLPGRFVSYMITAGILSLIRGFCIILTGLPPVAKEHLDDPNALMSGNEQWVAFNSIVNPFAVFFEGSANQFLTKDLFFSGHVASTFLLVLYCWPLKQIRYLMVVLHLFVLVSVFMSHLHYTVDVVGAYAITFALYMLREGRPERALEPGHLGKTWW